MGIGAVLRQEREKKGYALADLADFLRIQEDYLISIEADDFEPLLKQLGGAYVNGFIRTYARQLGLDADHAVAEFQREQTEAVSLPPLIVRQPIEEERLPSWRLIAAAVGLLIALILAWNYFHADPSAVSVVVPPVPERLAAAPVQNAPSVAKPAGPAAEESEDSNETSGEPPEKPYAAAATVAAPAAALGTSGVSRVAVHALENSWVQIDDGAGTAVFTGILHAGDVYRVPNEPGYTMTAGNAGGIALSLDETQGTRLGAIGQVMRGIPLDAKVLSGH